MPVGTDAAIGGLTVMRFGRKKLVTVLGAGPAGLLAAFAAQEMGHDVRVLTAPVPGEPLHPQKSALHGCQYLHAYIPGLGLGAEGHPVRYELVGTVDEYRRKVYGQHWNGSVSPDEYGPERDHLAWDLRKAYDRLWEVFAPSLTALVVTPEIARQFARSAETVLCTIPAPEVCLRPEEHKFLTQDVWAIGTRSDVCGLDKASMPYRAPDMTVTCNGNDAPRWYRAATVFGQSTLEWPAGTKPPILGVVSVQKPLNTDCDCHTTSGRWHRLGRYGQWRKGVLAHQAYEEAREVLRRW